MVSLRFFVGDDTWGTQAPDSTLTYDGKVFIENTSGGMILGLFGGSAAEEFDDEGNPVYKPLAKAKGKGKPKATAKAEAAPKKRKHAKDEELPPLHSPHPPGKGHSYNCLATFMFYVTFTTYRFACEGRGGEGERGEE